MGFYIAPVPGQEASVSDQERLYRVVAKDWHEPPPTQVLSPPPQPSIPPLIDLPTHPHLLPH